MRFSLVTVCQCAGPAGPGLAREAASGEDCERGLSSGALDTVWLQPVTPDNRLHDNFAVLFQRSFGLGQVIWYPGWRVILYRVTMPEAPPSVGSAIVAQSVGRNNDPVVPGWRLCQDINSLSLQEGFLRTPVSWSIRSVFLYLRNKWSSYVCVATFSQKPA